MGERLQQQVQSALDRVLSKSRIHDENIRSTTDALRRKAEGMQSLPLEDALKYIDISDLFE